MNLGHCQRYAFPGLFKTPYSSRGEHGPSACSSAFIPGWHRSCWMMLSVEMGISPRVMVCRPQWLHRRAGCSPLRRGGAGSPCSMAVLCADEGIAWAPAGQCCGQPGQSAGSDFARGGISPTANARSARGPWGACWGACHILASSAVQGCPGRTRSPCPIGSPRGPLVTAEPHCKVSRCNALRWTVWSPGRRAIFFPAMREITLKPVFVQSLLRRKYIFFSTGKKCSGGDKKCSFCIHLWLQKPVCMRRPGM